MADFPDVEVGKIYKILDGEAKGEVGVCEDKRESGFGHKWGRVAGQWVRTHFLEEVNPGEISSGELPKVQ